MRRGPTALSPSPLEGEGRGEGKKGPLSTRWPIYPWRHARAARTDEKRKARFFPSLRMTTREGRMTEGRQNDHGEGMTTGEGQNDRGEAE